MTKKLKHLILLIVPCCASMFSCGSSVQSSQSNSVETTHPAANRDSSNTSVLTIREKASVPDSTWGYGELLPQNYDEKSNWPFVVYFHGMFNCVGGQTLTQYVTSEGPIKEAIEHKWNLPMIILEPQSPCDWSVDHVDAFLDYVLSHYHVDPKKFYMAGYSFGSGGVSFYLDAHYQRVAAVLILSANAEYFLESTPGNLWNTHIPIWGAVAQDDTVVGPGITFDDVMKVWAAMGLDGSLPNQILPSYPGADSTAYFTTSDQRWAWVSGQTHLKNGRRSLQLIFSRCIKVAATM